MAKRAVEVCECDRCGKEPARTWRITGPDGAPREIELCDQHGAPIANAYALARPVPKKRQKTGTTGRGQRRLAETQPAEEQPPATPALPPLPGLPPLPPSQEPIWR